MDPSTVCRLCAGTFSDMIELFGDIGQEYDLVSKIHTHLPIMVTEEDALPVNVCHDCFNKLEFCHSFVESCLEADQKLKQSFGFSGEEFPETEDFSQVNECEQSSVTVYPKHVLKKEREEIQSSPIIVYPEDMSRSPSPGGQFTSENVNNAAQEIETGNVSEMQYSVEITPDGKLIQKSFPINVKDQGRLTTNDHAILPDLDITSDPNAGSATAEDFYITEENINKTKANQKTKEPVRVLILNPKNPKEVTPEDVLQALTNPESIQQSTSPIETLLKNASEKGENNEEVVDTSFSEFPELKNVKKIKRTLMYCCIHCHKIFPEKKELLIHQATEHKKKKLFTCTYCVPNVAFKNKDSLNEHLSLYHTEPETVTIQATPENFDQSNAENLNLLATESRPEGESSMSENMEVFLDSGDVQQNDFLLENEVDEESPTFKKNILQNSGSKSLMLAKRRGYDKISYKSLVKKRGRPRLKKLQCKCCTGTHSVLHNGIIYDCSVCEEKFCTYKKLAAHMPSHGEDCVLYMCDICGQTFYHKKYMKCHRELHNSNYQCAQCGKVFRNKVSLKAHHSVHSDNYMLCDICGKSMKEGSFRLHRMTHIEPDALKRFHCPLCGKGFRSTYHLKEHSHDHTNETPYKCPDCPKVFRKKSQLKQHSLVHMEVPKYPCTVCGRRFRRRDHLHTHLRTHEPKDKFPCRVCAQVFDNLKELHTHYTQHSEEEVSLARSKSRRVDPQECRYCGKVLLNKLTLQTHMTIHEGHKSKTFTCEICNKSYDMKSKLEVHSRLHTGEKPYQCSFCSSSFAVKCSLVVHERMHTGETPFKCDICTKAFRSQSCLAQHKTIHTDIRPFSCDICGRRFRRRDGRDAHTLVHTSERPWSCRLCGRTFKQKGERNRHEGKHYKNRSRALKMSRWFACAECGRSFKSENSLKVHIIADHGNYSTVLSCESFVESEVIVSECAEEEIQTELIVQDEDNILL